MAIVSSATAYGSGFGDDKDTGNGFEFTRRKKWPQLLLQELVGSALFCLKPFRMQRSSMDASGRTTVGTGWKIVYLSPSASDMLGHKSPDLESRDFTELIYPPDQPQFRTWLDSLLQATRPSAQNTSDSTDSSNSSLNEHQRQQSMTGTYGTNVSAGSGRSRTTYARIMGNEFIDSKKSGPVVWEIRAHATGLDEGGKGINAQGGGMNGLNMGLSSMGALGGTGNVGGQSGQDTNGTGGMTQTSGLGGTGGGEGNFRLDGAGTVIPSGRDENGLKGKAVWLMGRKIGDGSGEENGQSQSLDAFLELKLENEKLREELRELQYEIDDDDFQAARSHMHFSTTDPLSPTSSSPTPSSPTPSSSSSSPAREVVRKKKPGRPPKESNRDDIGGDRKRIKKMSISQAMGMGGMGGPAGFGAGAGAVGGAGALGMAGGAQGKEGGEGLHVCVTCGRTDSPEWRKGPLGPKTLCNACGLRWAKRNSTAPSRKEKKAAAEAAAAGHKK